MIDGDGGCTSVNQDQMVDGDGGCTSVNQDQMGMVDGERWVYFSESGSNGRW